MLKQSVHALVHLVDLGGGTVALGTSDEEETTRFLSRDNCRRLCQLGALYDNLSFLVLEGVIEPHGMVSNLYELVLMDFNGELDLKVLLKLLLALKFVEDEFPILSVINKFLEFGVSVLEASLHLPDLGLALDYVNEE